MNDVVIQENKVLERNGDCFFTSRPGAPWQLFFWIDGLTAFRRAFRSTSIGRLVPNQTLSLLGSSTGASTTTPLLIIWTKLSFSCRTVSTARMSSSDEGDASEVIKKAASKKPLTPKEKKAIEKIYQKKSQLEHILLRPDTYIGSVEQVTQPMWVYDTAEKKMVNREIKYVPGLYKIFDEILVNAADNKQRDPSMSLIKIDIEPDKKRITIWNNGKGIPVVEHKDEKMYVPTMIFGHLLTSSNYDDDEKKVTGGRNGYGAKLCNIFSNRFVVETASREYKKKFKQVWTKNMSGAGQPEVSPFGSGEDYTKVVFEPDLEKFKMEELEKDIIDLMSRRAYDIAGTSNGVKVMLNGERLPVKNFKEYVELYTADSTDEIGNPLKVIWERFGDRWEVAVTSSDTGFNQISFVNSIATTKGGRHVESIVDQLTKAMGVVLAKKNKTGVEIKPFQIKNHLWAFVNCLIENPTFDSQTKENMTLQAKSFGSKCALTDKFIGNVMKSGIVENILLFAKAKAETQLGKKIKGTKTSKLRGIPKLEDANDAGTKNSLDCTLILTEGDSAKALAVSGFSVVGRDKFGVFPLRGKLLNVREATHKQLLENAEINAIVKILGLQHKKVYMTEQDFKTLRYGRLMIMTDQDQDGSHIKGLLVNFIHHQWPSLLKHVFLEEFITPIVKATKGKEVVNFYSLPELEEWKANTAEAEQKKWKIKYYKGLGTSTSKEAKEYFADMARHRIRFKYSGPEDDAAIELAFAKTKADERKNWLTTGMELRKQRRLDGLGEMYLYTKDTRSVTYKKFVDEELILFSNMDNERSIPSLVDGLKPGQRKVMFTCFKRNDKREVKVAQLAGSVAEYSAYHHGEQSLMSTIVGLAQNFVGSNNINLLMPHGQFGTRLQGGKDSASPRYIFTLLSPLARCIFHPHDAPLLSYLNEDNQKIEPEWYMPIVPMVLINGAEGIGTGWMTKIPNYNPREIVANLRAMIRGEEPKAMRPWYQGYRGEVLPIDQTRWLTNGEVAILDEDDSIEITELPIRTWTQAYKESVIEPLLLGTEDGKGKGKPPQISDYKEYHTDTTVRFVVKMTHEKFEEFRREGFHKVFKLQQTMSMSSMVLFDANGVIKKYDTVEQIMHEFFTLRMVRYVMRKKYLDELLSAEALKLENQARFIGEKINRKIIIENIKRKEMILTLQRATPPYDSDPVKMWKKKSGGAEEEPASLEDDDPRKALVVDDKAPDYEYLLGMPLWSLTFERYQDLLKKRDEKNTELDILRKKSPADLYTADLDEFESKLTEVQNAEREDPDELSSPVKGKPAKGRGKGKGGAVAKADTLPASTGTRVEVSVDVATIAKFEKAKEAKDRKAAGITIKGGRKKKEEGELDENGVPRESTSPTKTSPDEKKPKPRAKKEPAEGGGKKMKQTTLDAEVTKKPAKGKKKKGSDDESSFDSADLSDDSDEVVLDDDEEDDDFEEKVEKMPKPKNRAAAPVFNGTDEAEAESPKRNRELSDKEDDDVIIDEPPKKVAKPTAKADVKENGSTKPKVEEKAKPAKKEEKEPIKKEEKAPKKPPQTVSLVSDSDEDEYDFKVDKKPAAKKAAPAKNGDKAPAKPKIAARTVKRESSEEFMPSTSAKSPVKKQNVVPKKKAMAFSDSDDEVVAPRARPGRAAAAAGAAKIHKLDHDSSAENIEDDDDDYLATID